jgi:vesicle-associated membrane protein 7
MAVYYGLVTRDDTVLAEYASIEGDFTQTAKMLLKNTPSSSILKTYTQGAKIFNFYTQDSITFLCYSDISLGRELSLQFLTEMKRQFPNYINKAAAFAEVIQRLVKLYSKESIHQVDRFGRIEKNLEMAIESTKSGIDKAIGRGQKMSVLIHKTGELGVGMRVLRSKAERLRKGFWRSRIKALGILLVLGVVVCYCFIFWISVESDR